MFFHGVFEERLVGQGVVCLARLRTRSFHEGNASWEQEKPLFGKNETRGPAFQRRSLYLAHYGEGYRSVAAGIETRQQVRPVVVCLENVLVYFGKKIEPYVPVFVNLLGAIDQACEQVAGFVERRWRLHEDRSVECVVRQRFPSAWKVFFELAVFEIASVVNDRDRIARDSEPSPVPVSQSHRHLISPGGLIRLEKTLVGQA